MNAANYEMGTWSSHIRVHEGKAFRPGQVLARTRMLECRFHQLGELGRTRYLNSSIENQSAVAVPRAAHEGASSESTGSRADEHVEDVFDDLVRNARSYAERQ